MSQFPADRTHTSALTVHDRESIRRSQSATALETSPERRTHIRYAHGGLTVELYKPGLRGVLARPESTQCIDFSISGLQVCSARALHAGERVLVDLRLFDLHIDELECAVCSVREYPSGSQPHGLLRCGLRFDFAHGRYMRSQQVSDALRRIGFALKQNARYL